IQLFEAAISGPGITDNSGRLSRRIFAAFGEFRIPLIAEANELSFARQLELSVGARRESFSDIGNATVPKVGVRWSLNRELSMRGTWTRSFRPPNLTDLVQKDSYGEILPLPDPSSPTGSTNVLVRYGTNPELQPEKARTWTLGTEFAPRFWPGASFSLTYFNVSYSGRISEEDLTVDVLSQPGLAWLVNRHFTQAQLD